LIDQCRATKNVNLQNLGQVVIQAPDPVLSKK